MSGYTQSELDDVQARWNLRFPPDLLESLLRNRPLIDDPACFDWVTADPKHIEERLAWPLEGLWFDVEYNNLWLPEWGDKPPEPRDQKSQLTEFVLAAPKLIPLLAHRYLPEEPFEAGNPIFSVYQSDIIYYGADLEDWISRDCPGKGSRRIEPKYKEIRFWSHLVDLNNQGFAAGKSIVSEAAKLGLPE